MRILVTVSLRFPPQGKSAEGEADPKARPIGVVDGQSVNIPTPRPGFNGVRNVVDGATYWIVVLGLTQEGQRGIPLGRTPLSTLPRKAPKS